MGLEVTVFYPFHPLCGRRLKVVSDGKETVSVVSAEERRLKIPSWMSRPEAAAHVITEEPTIDLRALLSLSRVLHPGKPADHATLSESETTPTTGGEEREARSVNGGDDRGGRAREEEDRR